MSEVISKTGLTKIFQLMKSKLANYIPISGGEVNGSLKVTGGVAVGDNVSLATTTEGGNVILKSPSGDIWEIDTCANNLRIFKYKKGTQSFEFECHMDGTTGEFKFPYGISLLGFYGRFFGQLFIGNVKFYGDCYCYGLISTIIIKINGMISSNENGSTTNDYVVGFNMTEILSRFGLNPDTALLESSIQYFSSNVECASAMAYGSRLTDTSINGVRVFRPSRIYTIDGSYGDWPTEAAIYTPGVCYSVEIILRR